MAGLRVLFLVPAAEERMAAGHEVLIRAGL